jgi:type I restriction enzyme S subunit
VTTLGWAPSLPDHWQTVPLNFVAKMGTGHTPDRSKPEYWENCTIPWITLTDASRHADSLAPIDDTNQHISEVGMRNSAAVLHPAGTVVLSRTASVGHSAQMGRPMATTQDFAAWTCGDRLDSRYLLLVLRAMKPEWERLAFGSTHRTIYMPDLESLRIPLPSVDEQRRIADFLYGGIGVLDEVNRRRSHQLAALDELVQSEVDAAIAQADDPAHVRLGHLAAVQTGVTVDANRQSDGNAVPFPYLRVANVQVGRVDLSFVAEIAVPRSAAAASMLREGDVLMTEGGDLDKLGRGTVWRGEITPCLHQNHVFAVRPNKQKLVPEYLALLTRSSMARDYFERTGNRTTNLASTSSSKIRDFRIPLPDVDVQRKVVDQVEERLRWITEFGDRVSRQLTLLAERRQALITAAVTGQIDVTTARGVAA